ncbi:nitrate regulatory gene2 protein [Forsythia ovata]|uniref:Nitrate regulatory gene2 protein n=1 Tax=Forsythia ovata TaxID=205694 RepID=A0ABD1VMU7_9LAMI
MGCSYSRIERQEMVSRCKARKYMKQFVKARQAFSVAHSMYLRSLRTTSSVLLQFATDETNLHSHQNTNQHLPSLPPLMPLPPPLPPMSTTSETTMTSSFATTTTTVNSVVFIWVGFQVPYSCRMQF